MDLAVLVLLNVVFFVVVYLLFSIRMGRAIEKSRKAGIPREFYHNVEMIVQYLDATLESVNQKNDALYKMLLRAETLKGELESLLDRSERSAPSGRRKTRKTPAGSARAVTTKSAKAAGSTGGSTRGVPPPTGTPMSGPAGTRVPNRTRSETGRHKVSSAGEAALERLLEQAGPDHVRWTKSEAQLPELIGAKANRPGAAPSVSPRVSTGGAAGSPLNGVFSGIGRLARRVLGGAAPHRDEEDGEGSGDLMPRSVNPASPSAVSFEEQLYGYAPARAAVRRSSPAQADENEAADGGTAGVLLRSAEPGRDSTVSAEQTEVDEAYFPDGIPHQVSTGERVADAGLPFPEVPDLSRAGDRATFVKALLRRGLGIQEIAVTTGISYQEIELIEKVMQTGAGRGVRGTRRGMLQERSGL